MTEKQLKQKNINQIEISEILKSEYKENIEELKQYMIKNHIEIITIKSIDYPTKLKNICDPPIVIYVKGNKKLLGEKSIAIVGCRDATMYGRKIAEKMAYNLSINNINIVSGLAIGVDSHAHIGTLKTKKNQGKTIAVIGNGLDDIYPKENKKLAENILESGGLIVSEYIVGIKPNKINFPARNRIISGLSDGVLVVEAKEKSGTLITVEYAIEQGKEVYAIPGNIDSVNSIGTNKLLKDGANFVTDVKDIINNMKLI